MARRSLYLEHLATVPLFSACSKKELGQLARHTTNIKVPVGQNLTVEGTLGYEFFVIISGEAAVSRGGKPVTTLGPGDYFGELSLLDRAPRDATIAALTAMETVVLNRDEFRSALVEAPSMTLKLLAGMARRLRAADLA